MYETERMLCEITGMAGFTLLPMAGAHGELTGAMIIAAYHKDKGRTRTKVICPDSAHGTNPASAALAGFEVVNIPSKDGMVDPEALRAAMSEDVAALMMTCPNTLGLFEEHLPEIVEICHSVDGSLLRRRNLNAILGKMPWATRLRLCT
jgi:glycine dehydrogenase subunit 2